MADLKPTPSTDVPVPPSGFWGVDVMTWIERAFYMAGILLMLVLVYRYIWPSFYAVPLGTWVWRLIMIGCIGYGGYKSGKLWFKYVRTVHIEGLKWKLLYVKLPRMAPRSIFSMEMILESLHDEGGTGTWRNLFWDGSVRKYATLEIASVEGKIYFFFRVLTGAVDYVKSQMYAQFPEVEITEVDDYVRYVPRYSADSKEWVLSGFEVQQVRASEPMYPIKTYIDYGLDRAGKAEERINPMANLLEILGALGPGEQFWIQIHMRAAASRFAVKDSKKFQDWKKEFGGNMKKFETELQDVIKTGAAADIDFGKKRVTEYMTDQERKLYDAVQRKMSKRMFDVGMRCVYIAKKEMSKGFAPGAVEGALRLFNAPGLNGLSAVAATNPMAFSHPWDNVMGSGTAKRRDNLYQAYIHRSYFYPPFNEYLDESPRKIMLLSAEEIATLFHFPGEEVSTGGLSRIEARKAEAPANLPIS
jgi:hypothetical protein